MPNISSNASIRAPARRVPPVSDSRWSVPSGGITDCGSTIVSKGGATAFRFVGRDFFEKTEKNSLRRGIFKFVSKSRMNFASSNKDNVQFIKKRNAMKKLLILAAAVFALGTSTVSADNDRPISVSELPEKAQQFIRQPFPQRKGLLRQDGARTLRYDLRGDLHQQFQGRIPEKRRLERGRLQIFDGSCRDHPSADRADTFPSTIPIRPSSRSTATNGITR